MGVEGTGCGRKQDESEKSIKQTVCTKGNDKYNARDVIEIMRSSGRTDCRERIQVWVSWL